MEGTPVSGSPVQEPAPSTGGPEALGSCYKIKQPVGITDVQLTLDLGRREEVLTL